MGEGFVSTLENSYFRVLIYTAVYYVLFFATTVTGYQCTSDSYNHTPSTPD